jgi:hypothetical protein
MLRKILLGPPFTPSIDSRLRGHGKQYQEPETEGLLGVVVTGYLFVIKYSSCYNTKIMMIIYYLLQEKGSSLH